MRCFLGGLILIFSFSFDPRDLFFFSSKKKKQLHLSHSFLLLQLSSSPYRTPPLHPPTPPQTKGYGYGFSRMSYSATQLTYEALEMPPPSSTAASQQASVVDTVTLSKTLGWTPPSPAAQQALYGSIAVTPEPTPPFTDSATATLVYLLKCLLLPEAAVKGLAQRFLPAGSEAFDGVYNQRTEWTPNQQWSTVVTFLDVMKAMGPGFEQFEVFFTSEFFLFFSPEPFRKSCSPLFCSPFCSSAIFPVNKPPKQKRYWRTLTNAGGRSYFPNAGSGYGGIGPA